METLIIIVAALIGGALGNVICSACVDAWDWFRHRRTRPTDEAEGVPVRLTFWGDTPTIICDPGMSEDDYTYVCEWMRASRGPSGYGSAFSTKDTH